MTQPKRIVRRCSRICTLCERWSQKMSDIDIPCQERIVRKVGDQNAIRELHNARKHQEEKECINKFESVRGIIVVSLPETLEGVRRSCRLCTGGFWRHYKDRVRERDVAPGNTPKAVERGSQKLLPNMFNQPLRRALRKKSLVGSVSPAGNTPLIPLKTGSGHLSVLLTKWPPVSASSRPTHQGLLIFSLPSCRTMADGLSINAGNWTTQ